MEKAIQRIEKAIQDKEGILIFGDKDVDGVSATAIIYKFLERLEANIVYRVPEGTENYGISKEVVSWAAMNELTLMITVDCGITSLDEIDYAASLGIDVIVTDHHETRERLPKAFAVINPKDHEDHYPYFTLSGSAVAFKLVCGFMEKSALPEYYNQDIVFFDIETTGLNPARDEIIEIGAVKMRNGVKTGEMQSLIRPAFPVSEEISKLTGITNAMLAQEGIELKDALEKFLNFIGNDKLVGHNIVDFDIKFINAALKKLSLNPIPNPTEDTLKMARVMLKKISDHKLCTVGQSLGVFPDKCILHRSIADSSLCAEIYRRLILHRTNKIMELYNEYLPLVAIGTIADIMPLTDENRIIVKNGLRLVPHSSIGLIYLIRAVNLNIEKLTSKEISWNISPLLNSPGRIGDASFSVKLLISNKIKETEELVKEIISKDLARKGIVDDGVGVVNNMLSQDAIRRERLIFIASKDFTRGTTGLLANRLCSQYQLPAVIVCIDNSSSSGSIRGITGMSVVSMLESMSHLFVQFGGHKAAGGFIIATEKLEEFKSLLVKYMETFNPDRLKEEIMIDAVLDSFDDLNLNMIRYMDNFLEPFGNSNDTPKLLFRGIRINSFREIGKTGDHALLTLQKNNREIAAIGWNWAARLRPFIKELPVNMSFDIVASPEINRYQGTEEVRLSLIDMRKV